MRTLNAVCTAMLCVLCSALYAPACPLAEGNGTMSYPTACQAAPYELTVEQEDGPTLKVRGLGNAFVHHSETIDGYTILRNSSGIYEYAAPGKAGRLVPSGIEANDPRNRNRRERRRVQRIGKHLRESEEQLEYKVRHLENDPQFAIGGTFTKFPSTGQHNVLVILIQYPDLENEYSSDDFEHLMNGGSDAGLNTFRDYFLKNSNGMLDLHTDVFGWYTSSRGFESYGYRNGFTGARELMAEAIDAAEAAGVDFSRYDNDGDGQADAVIGIHAGPGAEVGAQTQYIWSHRWTLGTSYERIYDGVIISDYIINPETRPWGMVGPGVICHEFGHVLGLPDLYDTDNSSSGVGNWALMGNGGWLNFEQTPANLCAWSKMDQGWIEPEVITQGAFSLGASDGTHECYRINTPDPEEYFLLENRQQVGNDAFLPGHGLAIWHIDERKTALYPGLNQVNADEFNKGVDLEEADGLDQLDFGPFQGDGGDLYPGTSGTTSFGTATFPSSDLNQSGTSDISITNIFEVGQQVYFRLNDAALCGILHADVGNTSNCAAGIFDQEVTIVHELSPGSGKLLVNGNDFPLTASPQNILLKGLPADGQLMDLEVGFSEDPSCSLLLEEAIKSPSGYDQVFVEMTCDPAQAGIQVEYHFSASGCDSTVTMEYVLTPSYHDTIRILTCNAGLAGATQQILQTAYGCDSLVTVITEYRPKDTVRLTSYSCAISTIQQEVFHLVAADGCDSIVLQTILPSWEGEVEVLRYTCDPDMIGTEVLTYTTDNGCDSIVTIHHQLAPTYELFLEKTTCDPSAAGTESQLFISQHGCDSMVTITHHYTPITADFSAGVDGLEVDFTGLSVNADEQLWFFGDGNAASGSTVAHTYDAPGLYFVILAAVNNECQSSEMTGRYILVEEAHIEEEKEVQADVAETPALSVYPNPTFGPVHVDITSMTDEPVVLEIVDLQGNILRRETGYSGNGIHTLDLQGAAPGMYVIRASSTRQKVIGKVMLVN